MYHRAADVYGVSNMPLMLCECLLRHLRDGMLLLNGNTIICHYHLWLQALIDDMALAADEAFISTHLH